MADTDTEGFLARWSRLKQEGRPVAVPEPEPKAAEEAAADEAAEPAQPAEPFDPSTLPPVDSLDADSDYTGFLAAGVPQELRLAALRKAWVSDPKIAGFRGFAEYDWDCNAPGYGQLLPTDSIRDMVEAMFREDTPKAKEEESTEVTEVAEAPSPEATDGMDGKAEG